MYLPPASLAPSMMLRCYATSPPDRVAGDQQQFVNVRRRGFQGFRPVTIGDAHGCAQVFGFFRIAGKRHDLRRVSLVFELMYDQTAE